MTSARGFGAVLLLGAALCACTWDWTVGRSDGGPAPDAGPVDDGGGGSLIQRSCQIAPEPPGCGLTRVIVSSDPFVLGEADGGPAAASPPQPNIRLSVGALDVDSYEVTVGRFRRFWRSGHPAPPAGTFIPYPGGKHIEWKGALREPIRVAFDADAGCTWTPTADAEENLPINCLDWDTSLAFCVWDGARLPTEAEREWIARYRPVAGLPSPRLYPWGDQPPTARCTQAQWDHCPGEDGGKPRVRPVGSFPGAGGLFDLGGNAGEWQADVYALYDDPGCWGGVAQTDPLCLTASPFDTVRAARGGDWNITGEANLRSDSRGYFAADTQRAQMGVRCVRSASP